MIQYDDNDNNNNDNDNDNDNDNEFRSVVTELCRGETELSHLRELKFVIFIFKILDFYKNYYY